VIDKQTKEAVYGVGGGIVWDSTTGNEYEECQVKARILTERRPSFQLLETMVWTPEEGIFLLELHLARLSDSARYFGYPLNPVTLQAQLANEVKRLPDRRHKIRLLLDEQGRTVFETTPLGGKQAGNPLRIGLSMWPVYTNNVFLYHKTTHRVVYEQARASRPDCDDVILWNERGEITEASIANVVLNLDGRWLTPALHSGLLAGTFRNHLLSIGEITEQIVRKGDLWRADEIFLINSVQGWMRAELVDELTEEVNFSDVPQ
jgi:para-aminobenzoate synthetase/4-amino-4-deoxychorismate lyase